MILTIPLEKNPKIRPHSVWNLKHFNLNVVQRGKHWAPFQEAKKTWEQFVRSEATNAKIPLLNCPFIEVTCYFPTATTQDPDNILVMKPIMDGLVTAGVLTDDTRHDYTTKPIGIEIDRDNPRVEIVINGEE